MRWLFLAVGLAFGNCVSAETVGVRSGEHVDFSRLVLDLESPAEWIFGRTDNGYGLQLERRNLAVDLSGVFQRMSEKRIKEVFFDSDQSRLILRVDCDCHADAFEIRNGKIVLDVKDGPAPENSPFENMLVSGETGEEINAEAPSAEEEMPTIPDQERESVQPAPVPDNSISYRGILPYLANDATPEVSVKIPDPAFQSRDIVRERVIHQISRAVSQGLLEANIRSPLVAPIEATDQEQPQDPAPSQSKEQDSVAEASNFRLTTSIDQAMEARVEPVENDTCPSAASFSISEWGSEANLLASVSSSRQGIFDDAQMINDEGVRDLVRANLYATFATEAISILNQYGQNLQDRHALMVIAELVEPGLLNTDLHIVARDDCSGIIGLWAMLNDSSVLRELDSQDVKFAFNALPLHLRRHLGARVAQAFLDQGDAASAQAIQNSLARGTILNATDKTLIDAKLALHRDDEIDLESVFGGLRDVSGDLAPELVIEFVNLKADRGEQIDEGLIHDIEAILNESRGVNYETSLRLALIRAWANAGQIGSALTALANIGDGNQSQDTGDVLHEVLSKLADEESDGTFLRKLAENFESILATEGQEQQRSAIAKRALHLGFPKMAAILSDGDSLARMSQAMIEGQSSNDPLAQFVSEWASNNNVDQPESDFSEGSDLSKENYAAWSLTTARATLGESGELRHAVANLLEQIEN